jgi:hypothetical protein
VLDKVPLREMANLRVTLPSVPPGECLVEWWNTHTGEVIQDAKVTADGGGLRLSVPRFTGDIAALIRRPAKPN